LRKSNGWYDRNHIWHWYPLEYKIIIPKEEPKNPNNQEIMFHEEYKEYFYEDFIDGKFVTVWLGKDYIPQEEPKQETLEEAAENWLKTKTLIKSSQAPGLLVGFIEGAKWQAKRMYISNKLRK
jgi:hypothetical protein